jgi:L-ascorbate metabolism protein UlaG (beta-lactamase superfamily)
MTLKNLGGVYSFADFKITGFADKHIVETQSPVYTREVMDQLYPFPNVPVEDRDNSIFLIETGGLRIVHWGDNRQNPPQDIWDNLKDIDIAILPVSDDGRVLTPEWADTIASKMNAKVVIPTHYFMGNINIPGAGWEKSAEEYTRAREHTVLDTHTVKFNAGMIKDYQNHVMYFGENVAFSTDQIQTGKNETVPDLPEVKPVWENL